MPLALVCRSQSYFANLSGLINDHFSEQNVCPLGFPGSSFTGKVIQENTSLGKLVVLLDSGYVQNFFRRNISCWGKVKNWKFQAVVFLWIDAKAIFETIGLAPKTMKRIFSEIASSQATPSVKKPIVDKHQVKMRLRQSLIAFTWNVCFAKETRAAWNSWQGMVDYTFSTSTPGT